MEKQTQDLIEQLRNLNVKIIENISDFNKVINVTDLKKSVNTLENKKDTIIFFDSQSYNENTFTDYIIKFLTEFKNITFSEFSKMFSLDNNDTKKESTFYNSFKEKVINQTELTDIYYCNDLKTYQEIFEKFYSKKEEKEKINTTVLSFKYNEKESSSFIDFETFSPLNTKNIAKIFLNLSNL